MIIDVPGESTSKSVKSQLHTLVQLSRNALVSSASSCIWDYLYLTIFVIATFLAPYLCEAIISSVDLHMNQQQTSDLIPMLMVWLLFLMGCIPVIPITSAIIVRIFCFEYLKKLSLRSDEMKWGLFFLLTLRIIHYEPTYDPTSRKLQNIFDFFSLIKIRVLRKIGLSIDDNGKVPNSASNVHEDINSLSSFQNEVSNEENNSEESISSDSSSTSDVELAENEIAWTCVICHEVNIQERKQHDPSHKIHLLGTKENSSRIRICIDNVGDLEDQYKVKFKQIRNVNYCRKCFTPYDYKPRNKELEQAALHHPAINKNCDGIAAKARQNEKEAAFNLNTNHVDSYHIACTNSFHEILKLRNISLKNKFRCIQSKISVSYQKNFIERNDPPPVQPSDERRLYYKNYYSLRYIERYTPTLLRRILQPGEQYEEGMWIESTEERSDANFYPGRIKKVRRNEKYDIIYDNGMLVECVDKEKIRFRLTFTVSFVTRIILLSLLRLVIVCPMLLSSDISMNHPDMRENRISKFIHGIASGNKSYFQSNLFLFRDVTVMIVAALFLAQIYSFWMTARSGIWLHTKIFLFCSFPYWMLLATAISFECKRNEQVTESFLINWWHCVVMSLFFSFAMNTHFYFYGNWWAYLGILLSIPLVTFEFIAAFTADSVVKGYSMMQIFVPLQFFSILLLFSRGMVPLIRDPGF